MATENQYYRFLVRIDHPVFFKDFSDTQDANSPFNSILTRIFARRLSEARGALDSFIANSFPHTVNADGIDDWEVEYFGFLKQSLGLSDRVAQLLIKYKNQLRMNEPSVEAVAQAITGQTPEIIRNLWKSGWVLGKSVLGTDTILGQSQNVSAGTYILIFSKPLTSEQRYNLDRELKKIQKGGAKHSIISPKIGWIVGTSALGVDTVL